MKRVTTAAVLTHRRRDVTARRAAQRSSRSRRERGVEIRLDPEETAKHRIEPGSSLTLAAPLDPTVDICFALGGDGTILNALRTYAGTGVPVFGINFGEMGFLAAVDREEADIGCVRALDGRLRGPVAARDRAVEQRRPVARDQRHLDPPPAGSAGRRPRVLGRRRRGRTGAL